MPGGFCWYLADACWEDWAKRANRQMTCDTPGEDVEILKKSPRRLVLRLKSAEADTPEKSIVTKGFPMLSLKERLLRYRRYGPAEVRNLLEASKNNLPVPRVFGYGQIQRWRLVLGTIIMMEDLAPRQPVGELLKKTQGQPQQQAKILEQTVKLFSQLYLAGCNHIDTNSHSIWLGENLTDGEAISDFQYVRFLKRPSIKPLLCQAALFARSCSPMVPAEVLQNWIEKVVVAVDVNNATHCLKVYNRFRERKLSRAQRLALR